LLFYKGREKRRFEMNTNGFYGDTFSGRFGDFYTAKKQSPALENKAWKETPFCFSRTGTRLHILSQPQVYDKY
jgi:hypothetical protein